MVPIIDNTINTKPVHIAAKAAGVALSIMKEILDVQSLIPYVEYGVLW